MKLLFITISLSIFLGLKVNAQMVIQKPSRNYNNLLQQAKSAIDAQITPIIPDLTTMQRAQLQGIWMKYYLGVDSIVSKYAGTSNFDALNRSIESFTSEKNEKILTHLFDHQKATFVRQMEKSRMVIKKQ